MKKIVAAWVALCLLVAPSVVLAQSTAQPVVPGYLTTSGCPSGFTSCFVQYGAAGTGGAMSNAPVFLRMVPTVSATQLPAGPLTNGTIIQIPSTNTGTICLGKDNTVTAATTYPTASACYSVASGITSGSVGINNQNLLWIISSNGTDGIQFTGN